MTGYVYVTLLLLVLIALGFVLSGGLILSKRSSSTVKSAELYKLVDKEAVPSQQTLQMSTLDLTPCGLGGLDIALVIDRSVSITSGPFIQMKDEAKAFVTSLSGSSTKFSVTAFSTTARQIKPLTDSFEEVIIAIDSIPIPTLDHGDGSTNWQDGLIKAKITLGDPTSNRPSNPDLIIFISDGEPNKYYNNISNENNLTGLTGSGGNFDQDSLNAAISIANTIKANGTTILTLGIGSRITEQNLIDISGQGTSGPAFEEYVILTTFNTLNDAFSKLTTSTCSQ